MVVVVIVKKGKRNEFSRLTNNDNEKWDFFFSAQRAANSECFNDLAKTKKQKCSLCVRHWGTGEYLREEFLGHFSLV